MNINESTRHYISTHASSDVSHLALHPSKDPQVDMAVALQQIAGRQKAREKLPEWYATEGILYPKKVSMEQCSSTQTAEYKASLVQGDTFADFSGGFGVDTAAFAKKFGKGYYVEPQQELCELFQHNCNMLDINNVEIINGTMEDHLAAIGPVDMIYLDPSRRDMHGRRVVSLSDCTPNLPKWKSALLERCNILMVKMSPMIDIYQTLRDLPETYAVHVVAVEGECKEVVFLLSRGDAMHCVSTTGPNLVALDIHKTTTTRVETTLQTERTTLPCIATELGAYLYEPNAAVMKAGIFNTLSEQFRIAKLAKSTNLFTANELHEDFPGRVFRIEAMHEFHPRKTAKDLSHLTSASIAVRNFPLTTEELRKTLKTKDGNGTYLFGCTLWNGSRVILQTNKI